jgi:AraC-like DNA-binding protein/mannose-6-phosphate isomerase-like protein (cupin superfamily)
MPRATRTTPDLRILDYRPAAPYRLDADIFTVAELRRRAGAGVFRHTYRYACHALWYVTRGECVQTIDFEPVACRAGTLLLTRPGQVHAIDPGARWDGWIILFAPEFLRPEHDGFPAGPGYLPDRLHLDPGDVPTFTQAIVRMYKDAHGDAAPAALQPLLRHQLYALLLRVAIAGARLDVVHGTRTGAARRFAKFRDLVEHRHAIWHHVGPYADSLHCSERTLTRAALDMAGMSAKAFIASRISLEAKRLLAHTSRSVTSIGESLGFDETTNFVKFFRRESGCTPAGFRRALQALR